MESLLEISRFMPPEQRDTEVKIDGAFVKKKLARVMERGSVKRFTPEHRSGSDPGWPRGQREANRGLGLEVYRSRAVDKAICIGAQWQIETLTCRPREASLHANYAPAEIVPRSREGVYPSTSRPSALST